MTLKEFEHKALMMEPYFSGFVSYLQAELEQNVFTLSEDKYAELRIKHNYLSELNNIIETIKTNAAIAANKEELPHE